MFTDPDNWAGGFYELSIDVGHRDEPLTVESSSRFGHLYGRLTLPDGAVSVCGGLAIRLDDESTGEPVPTDGGIEPCGDELRYHPANV